MSNQIRRVRIGTLEPHPLNQQVYAATTGDDLVESIQRLGIIEPLVITPERIVISGHRRLAAAAQLGLKTVPARIERFDDETTALVEFNRQRLKSWSERYRELQVLLPHLRSNAAERRLDGARRGAARRHGLPETHMGRMHGRSRVYDDASHLTGLSREKIRKLIRICEAVEAKTAPKSIIDDLDAGRTTVHQAYLAVKRSEAAGSQRQMIKEDTAAGRYVLNGELQPFDVWNFPRRDRQFDDLDGDSGSPPAQVWINLIHYFSSEGDLVLDPMAGTGTVQRVAEWMQRRCESYDIRPRGSCIIKHDLLRSPPDTVESPKLIIVDPPLGDQRKYSRSRSDLSRCGSFAEYIDRLEIAIDHCLAILCNEGYLALVIGNGYMHGQFRDLSWVVARVLDRRARLVRRISVPYSTSQHPGHAVAKARARKDMLALTREILVARRQ